VSDTHVSDPYTTRADLGGTTGHGPIEYEPEGVVFHNRWEARALALTVAAGASGKWNIDMSRRFRETLPDYLGLSYYEIWTAGLERLVVDRGLVTGAEAGGHGADFFFGQLTNGKTGAPEFFLGKHREDIGLVLGVVLAPGKHPIRPVIVVSGVMAGNQDIAIEVVQSRE
jgi:hypothetical protein